jgi:hypothetical protein
MGAQQQGRRVTVLDVTEYAYHQDQVADEPTISRSFIHTMIQRSPWHAWAQHPRLNPEYVTPEGEAKFDLGTAAHALFLEGRDLVEVIFADDWKTKAAKEARDLARAHGRIPLLEDQYIRVLEMLTALDAQMPDGFFQGEKEVTVVWRDRDVLCRARPDSYDSDLGIIDDYKTTSKSAEPAAWSKSMLSGGFDLQAAFYMRATGATPFRFLVQETFEPYAVQTFELAPDALALANRKIDWALDTWKACVEADHWPGYPSRTAFVTLPPWAEQQWFDREARDAA